jgi:DDB1- and CUL4-associated factor 13
MKIQTLRRDPVENRLSVTAAAAQQQHHILARECPGDIARQSRNLNEAVHPLARVREYQRAVNAVKLDRMFAKPFLGDFEQGHQDGITTLSTSRRALLPLVSGCVDGSIKLWDIATRTCLFTLPTAHTRIVTGSVFDVGGRNFYTCSDDGFVHRWSIHADNRSVDSDAKDDAEDGRKPAAIPTRGEKRHRSLRTLGSEDMPEAAVASHGPLGTWRTNGSFKSLDHHWQDNLFVTASDECVQVWAPDRTLPVQTHRDLWSNTHDTVNVVRYNPAERNLLAHCSSDRGIGLHDTRTASALSKVVMKMRSNDLQWNPMEPMNFLAANEDGNAYTFDIRKLEVPTRIFKGHVNAVLSCSWSPTGTEFVTGSYDRTIRIFNLKDKVGKARDVYHTKRMQRVHNVVYTQDAKYILSGSDDTNIRLWKAIASEQSGQRTSREEAAKSYRAALIKKYQHVPEVARIRNSRKIPKIITKITAQNTLQKESSQKKQSNRIKYNSKKPGAPQHQFHNEKKQAVARKIE